MNNNNDKDNDNEAVRDIHPQLPTFSAELAIRLRPNNDNVDVGNNNGNNNGVVRNSRRQPSLPSTESTSGRLGSPGSNSTTAGSLINAPIASTVSVGTQTEPLESEDQAMQEQSEESDEEEYDEEYDMYYGSGDGPEAWHAARRAARQAVPLEREVQAGSTLTVNENPVNEHPKEEKLEHQAARSDVENGEYDRYYDPRDEYRDYLAPSRLLWERQRTVQQEFLLSLFQETRLPTETTTSSEMDHMQELNNYLEDEEREPSSAHSIDDAPDLPKGSSIFGNGDISYQPTQPQQPTGNSPQDEPVQSQSPAVDDPSSEALPSTDDVYRSWRPVGPSSTEYVYPDRPQAPTDDGFPAATPLSVMETDYPNSTERGWVDMLRQLYNDEDIRNFLGSDDDDDSRPDIDHENIDKFRRYFDEDDEDDDSEDDEDDDDDDDDEEDIIRHKQAKYMLGNSVTGLHSRRSPLIRSHSAPSRQQRPQNPAWLNLSTQEAAALRPLPKDSDDETGGAYCRSIEEAWLHLSATMNSRILDKEQMDRLEEAWLRLSAAFQAATTKEKQTDAEASTGIAPASTTPSRDLFLTNNEQAIFHELTYHILGGVLPEADVKAAIFVAVEEANDQSGNWSWMAPEGGLRHALGLARKSQRQRAEAEIQRAETERFRAAYHAVFGEDPREGETSQEAWDRYTEAWPDEAVFPLAERLNPNYFRGLHTLPQWDVRDATPWDDYDDDLQAWADQDQDEDEEDEMEDADGGDAVQE